MDGIDLVGQQRDVASVVFFTYKVGLKTLILGLPKIIGYQEFLERGAKGYKVLQISSIIC